MEKIRRNAPIQDGALLINVTFFFSYVITGDKQSHILRSRRYLRMTQNAQRM